MRYAAMDAEKDRGKQGEFSFEHKIFNTVLEFGIIIACLSVVSNYLTGLGTLITGTSVVAGLIVGMLYWLSVYKKIYRVSIVLFIVFLFIFTPFMWLTSGGIAGSTAFCIILFSALIAVLLRGIPRLIALGCFVLTTFSLILLEYMYPAIIISYNNDFQRYIDVSVGLLMVLISITSLFAVIIRHYIIEHRQANLYLAEIEKRKIDSLNQQFVRVFNASPSLLAICRERDFMYVEANDAWLDALGYARNEIVGWTEDALNILLSEMQKKRVGTMTAGNHEEFRVRTKQGEILEWLMSKAEIEMDGEACFLLTAVDRTLFKQLEKEITRIDRLNLVGEMATSIGHEIRNPLTTVRGFLQLFQRKERYLQDRENINLMIEELDSANTIITEFLSLAKNRNINLRPVSLNRIITELHPLIYAAAVRQGVEVSLELEDVPTVLADENEIRRLILNLAQNAREAISESGSIVISTRMVDEQVVLSVSDTGKGIPPEVYNKLGTPFVSTKDQGPGLGLAVCYRIAERHRARIIVDTSPAGTTFSLSFTPCRGLGYAQQDREEKQA